MIKVDNLSKRYGRIAAIDNLSFEVKRREIVGLLGPNGAGKTTTMQILACYLPATGGRVEVAGFDAFSDSIEVRRRVGYMPEHVAIYPDMRVIEYLRYRGKLKGLGGSRLRARLGDVLTACGLEDVSRRIVGTLSRGYRQRVGLADSLIHEPELLILDEPTVGLDPNQIRQIRVLIRSLSQRHTILLASHILPEVESVCERVLIMHKGRIVASDTPGNLVGLLKGNLRVTVELRGAAMAEIEAGLRAVPGMARVWGESVGDWLRFECECGGEADIREAVFALAAANRWSLRELTGAKRNLEDVFVAVTREGAAV